MITKRMITPQSSKSNDRANGSSYRPISKGDINSKRTLVRPSTPTPNSKWDFAFLTVGVDFTEEFTVAVNDVPLPPFLNGGDVIKGLTNALFSRGVGLYTTYDSYGCWLMYRFQNLTNLPVKISMLGAKQGDHGISILTGDAENMNPTIVVEREDTNIYGYDKASFTLAPNTKPQLVNVHPKQVIYSQEYNYYPMHLVDDLENPFEYSFKVNNVLVKDVDGVSKFTITTQDDLLKVYDLIALKGISLNAINNYAWTKLDMGFNTLDEADNTLYKIEVTQFGNITTAKDNVLTAILDGDLLEDQLIVSRGVDFVSYTAYVYDPLDLDNPDVGAG